MSTRDVIECSNDVAMSHLIIIRFFWKPFSCFFQNKMSYLVVSKKKNPLFVWEWDRKIRPSWLYFVSTRQASWCQSAIPGMDFLSHPHTQNGLYSRTSDRDIGCFYPFKINIIHHWCSVGTEKSKPKGPPFQWEKRLAEFPPERWTLGLGFFWNHWTPMIDSFSHIPRPYDTVLCNICWWRHWGRCKQSMTRAVPINLKQRINSALNNEQRVISPKWINKN